MRFHSMDQAPSKTKLLWSNKRCLLFLPCYIPYTRSLSLTVLLKSVFFPVPFRKLRENQFQQSEHSFASLENKTAAQAANGRSSSKTKRSEIKNRTNDEEFYSIFILIFISCWMLQRSVFFFIRSLSAILMCPFRFLSLAVCVLPLRHHLALWSCGLAFNVFFVTWRSSTHLPLFILLTHRKWI